MKTQELIESGLLELYVLGIATPEDIALVQEALSNPAVEEEIQRIESTLQNITTTKPSDKVYNNLVATLDFADENPESSSIPKEDTTVIELKSRTQRYQTWMRAAMIALIVSLGLNGLQLNNYQGQIQQIAELQNINQVLASDVKVVRDDNQYMDKMLSFFEVGEVQSVKLQCLNESGNDYGTVYWNKNSGRVSINASTFPAIDNEHSYQLWAIVDGKPVDLGVIPNDSVGLNQITMLKETNASQAFCITVEPYGGKPEPSLDQLVAMTSV